MDVTKANNASAQTNAVSDTQKPHPEPESEGDPVAHDAQSTAAFAAAQTTTSSPEAAAASSGTLDAQNSSGAGKIAVNGNKPTSVPGTNLAGAAPTTVPPSDTAQLHNVGPGQLDGGGQVAQSPSITTPLQGGNLAASQTTAQTVIVNVDLMDASGQALNARSNNASLLSADSEVQSQPLSNALQTLIDAAMQNSTAQLMQQQTEQNTQQWLQTQTRSSGSTSAQTAQQNERATSSTDANTQPTATQMQEAHAGKLAQQTPHLGGAADAITEALLAELLTMTPLGTEAQAADDNSTEQTQGMLNEAQAQIQHAESRVKFSSLQQGIDPTVHAALSSETAFSHDTKQSFSLASLPQDSDAARMLQQYDSHIATSDPRTFYRDAETGRFLMRAGEGPWVIFDAAGRTLGQWRSNKQSRTDIKIASRGQIHRGNERMCKYYNECEREGLPSCCMSQGTF